MQDCATVPPTRVGAGGGPGKARLHLLTSAEAGSEPPACARSRLTACLVGELRVLPSRLWFPLVSA